MVPLITWARYPLPKQTSTKAFNSPVCLSIAGTFSLIRRVILLSIPSPNQIEKQISQRPANKCLRIKLTKHSAYMLNRQRALRIETG